MKKLMMMAACAGVMIAGCSVKKIEFEKKENGEVSYRIYENDHWLKTEATGLRGGMTKEGNFEFEAEGMKSSPSEEFNRTIMTYTTAFVQLAQIAAAAYNPSASSVIKTATASAQEAKTSNKQTTVTTNAADCVDCTAK